MYISVAYIIVLMPDSGSQRMNENTYSGITYSVPNRHTTVPLTLIWLTERETQKQTLPHFNIS